MAGQPIKRMLVAELERLASEFEEGMSALDYVCMRTAEGDTLATICRDVSDNIGQTIGSGTLSTWLNTDTARRAAITAARAISAHVLAEESIELADRLAEDGTEVTREEIALMKERTEGRRWLASKRDRATYGGEVAQVNVQISTGQLLLDALRQRQVQSAPVQPLLPLSGDDVEVVKPDQDEDSA